MRKDIRAGFYNSAQSGNRAPKVRNENLDTDLATCLARLTDRLGEDISPAVVEIIAVHGSYDDIFQIQLSNSCGHAARFIQIIFIRQAALHRTEFACSSASIPQNHESRRACSPT